MMRRVAVFGAWLGLILALVGAGVVATASTEVGASGKKSVFKPKKYAGKWSGKWTNKTFSSKGAASMNLKLKGKTMIGVFDLGGNAFGCPDPDPRKVKLKKGKGANSWSKKGFKVRYSNDQGPVSLTYKQKSQKLTGSGVSPCTAAIAYSFKGKMTTKKATADVDITNGGAPFAKSNLVLKKK
jgi:hypothetical protein